MAYTEKAFVLHETTACPTRHFWLSYTALLTFLHEEKGVFTRRFRFGDNVGRGCLTRSRGERGVYLTGFTGVTRLPLGLSRRHLPAKRGERDIRDGMAGIVCGGRGSGDTSPKRVLRTCQCLKSLLHQLISNLAVPFVSCLRQTGLEDAQKPSGFVIVAAVLR